MSVGEITALIIAVTGVAGLFVSFKLGKRGQHVDEKQQAAAAKLQERIAAFDELEKLNTRLAAEVDRMTDLLVETETRGDVRQSVQARRCREQLEQAMAAMVTLQSVVISEVARQSASDTKDQAQRHIDADHPTTD